MDKATVKGWEEKYEAASKGNPLEGVRGLLAYNSVIDKVLSLDEGVLARLREPKQVPPIFAKAADDLQDLAEGLCYSISNGLALEVICSEKVIRFLESMGDYEERPGGQVLTVARLLSDFAAGGIFVHPDRFSQKMASLYRGVEAKVPLDAGEGEGVRYVKAEDFHWDCTPEAHYILEYPKGLSFGGGPSPRANRFIAAPETRIIFHDGWEASLPTVCKECDLFFLAGLNHMGEDYEDSFQAVREHLLIAKAANPTLKVHVEITSVPDLMKREAIIDRVLPLVDSVGLNETELADIAFLQGLPSWEKVRSDPVYQLEAMHLIQALGVKRVNMHTLGYYLCLSPNPVKEVRNTLLFAGLVGTARAATGRSPRPADICVARKFPLSQKGKKGLARLGDLMALKGFSRREMVEEGWCPEENLVAVPTMLVSRPGHTVGLGDTISGAAVFSERWE